MLLKVTVLSFQGANRGHENNLDFKNKILLD